MNKIILFLITVIILCCSDILFSQQLQYSNDSAPNNSDPAVMSRNDFDFKQPKPENKHSKEGLRIIEEMNYLKNNDQPSEGPKILELQKKLELIDHISVTKSAELSMEKFSDNANTKTNLNQSDAITLSSIYSSANSIVKAISTQTEQKGSGYGTIWTAVAVGKADSGVSATADTILLYKSVNNGLSYILYTRIAANPGNKVSYDELDMEIIESLSQKFIYLTLGYVTNGYTGLYRTSFIVFDVLNNINLVQPINFPGTASSSKYYRPRITSDNARYIDLAYVTISLVQDSTDGLNHFYMTKFCRILNPYNVSPSVTYMPQAITLFLIYSPFSSTVHADIAYYNTGNVSAGDSIIFVLSGYPGYTDYIFIFKGYSNALEYPHLSKILTGNTNEKQFARIASTGGGDQRKMLITFAENYYTGPNFSSILYTYSTTDANNWTKAAVLSAGQIFTIKNPDIIGQRNLPGKFYLSFKVDAPLMDLVGSVYYNDLTVTSKIFNLNNAGGKSYASPKPGFRLSGSDSCLIIWSNTSTLYSSCGCSSINIAARFYIQGLYDSISHSPKYDVSTLYLRNSSVPFALVDSAKGYSSTLFTFQNAVPGTYYLSMTHRNSIETWYYLPIALYYNSQPEIDINANSAKAYGNNLIKVDNSPIRYANYSGDVNQDDVIDLTDVIKIYNDANSFLTGYVVSDLTMNNIVDLTDVLMAYNNSNAFVSTKRP